MKKVIIVRNPESEALRLIDFSVPDQTVILMQDAVYDAGLREKGFSLEEDVHARGIAGAKTIDYAKMVEAIFAADKVMCI